MFNPKAFTAHDATKANPVFIATAAFGGSSRGRWMQWH
jgi:hypothetical protein